MRIVLDPGHGGKDPGAIKHPLVEKSLNLELAIIVYATLHAAGHEVLMTRYGDETRSTSARASFANSHDADLFISLHHNSYKSDKAHGVEVLIYSGASMGFRFGQRILNRLDWKIFSRGLKLRPNLVVLRKTRMPAILIEAAFISSAIDRRDTLLDRVYPEQKRWEYYTRIADAIKQSIS